MTELYDIENALHEVARARRRHRSDPAVREEAKFGRNLAEHVKQHFGPEAWETVGMALLIGAASLGAIPAAVGERDSMDGRLAGVMVNIQAFAGEQIVRDARALDDADHAAVKA